MSMFKRKNDIQGHTQQHDVIANKYVLRCFTITMIVYLAAFLMNLAGIFVIEHKLMFSAFIPSLVIYLTVCVVCSVVPLSDRRIKYFMLSAIILLFTVTGVFITYHVVLASLLPFLYAGLYSSKKVMRYVYILTVFSTIIIVYGGYYFGLCDANMTLLTTETLDNYVSDGQFLLTEVNANPLVTLGLFFVIPRCLIYIAFTAICKSIYNILSENIEKAKISDELEKEVRLKTKEIRAQKKEIKRRYEQTVTALGEAVDANDRYTSGHSKRVAEYAKMIAQRAGKSKEEQEEIYRAGLLHDIGKIRIPTEIINKTSRLTDEETHMMKLHTVTGYNILDGISENGDIAFGAKYHHERYDGAGYPNGLAGERIPEVARILGVADSYDAMASNRSYRDALPQHLIREEIENGKGTQFDPVYADIMLQIIDEDTEYRFRQDELIQRRILTVDDEPENNEILTQIIGDERMYEVVLAGSGKEALELLKKQAFDLIILDVGMPEMNGVETLKRIRKKYNTPVVLMTSDKTFEVSEGFGEYGCNDYITKPFMPLVVKEIVHNLTEKANVAK